MRPNRVILSIRHAFIAVLASAFCMSAIAAPPAPGRYLAQLPCADCPGIDARLDLAADGTYTLSERYRDREGGTDSIGRWSMATDGRTLMLRSERREPLYLAVRDEWTLEQLDREAQPIVTASAAEYRFRLDEAFVPLTLRLTLTGFYRQGEGAPSFKACATGQVLTISSAENDAALDRAYRETRRSADEPLMAQIRGRIEQQSQTAAPVLTVEAFEGFRPGIECPPPPGNSPLANTHWRLTRLGERAAGEGLVHEPHLVFDPTGRVIGATGCNRLVARYETDGNTLRIESIVATRMACAQGMETEQSLLNALRATRGWRIVGSLLDFYDENGRPLGHFEAAAKP